MVITVALLIGLIVGSFINVVTIRLFKGEGFISGRSRCPECKNNIAWYDMVPIASFIFLRRRCRACGDKISWQYPIVEAITGLGFLAFFAFGSSLVASSWLSVLWALSVLVAVYDIKHQIIPDIFLVFIAVWFLVGFLFFVRDTILLRVFAGLVFSGFFILMHIVSRGRWVGLGDAKLSFFLGAWVGWPLTLVALLLSYIVGAIVVLPFIFSGKASLSSRVPFGPFLIFASWVVFLWGREVINWYLLLDYGF